MSSFSTQLPPVRIEGVGFWASRLPGWGIARAVMRGEQSAPEAAVPRPAPTLLAPTERRRAPDSVAIALEVAAQACIAAKRDPATLASVFASTHGDLAISDYLCSTLVETPTLISPVKFHNSVHNAAAGYWSIGVRSHAPYTAVSSFESSFATGLLEAVTQVACDGGPVLYVAFDIEAKGPLSTVIPSRGLLGTALVLAPCGMPDGEISDVGQTEAAHDSRLTLQISVQPRSGAGVAPTIETTPARSPAAPVVSDNAMAECLPFLEALASDRTCEVALQLNRNAALRIRVISP